MYESIVTRYALVFYAHRIWLIKNDHIMTFGISSPRSKNKKLTSAIGTNGALTRKKGIKKTTAGNNDKHVPSAASAGRSVSPQTRITVATPRTTDSSKGGKSKLKSIQIKRSKDSTNTVYTRRTSPIIHEAEEQHLQEPAVEDRDDASAFDVESRRSLGSREHASSSEERKSVVQVLEEEFQTASTGIEDKEDAERDPAGPDQAAALNIDEERNENEFEDPPPKLEALEEPDDDERVPAKGREEEERADVDNHTNISEADTYASPEEIEAIDEATTGAFSNARDKPRSPRHPSGSNPEHRNSNSNERDSERERGAERRNKTFESKSNERPPRERSSKSRYHDKKRGDGRRDRERRRRDKSSSTPSKRDKGKLSRVDGYLRRDDGKYVDDDQTESTGFTDARGNDSGVGGGIKKKFENGVEEVHGTTQDILLSVFQICCAFALRGTEINDFVKEIDNARAELR